MVMINCVVRLRWRLFTLLCVRRSGCWWQGQGGWFNMMLEYCLLSTTYFICAEYKASDWQWPIIQLMLEISNPQSPIHVSNWGISHCSLRYENKGNSIFNFFHWRRGQQSLLYFQSFWHPEKRQWDFKISDGSLDCSELHSPIEAPIGRRTVWMIVLNYSISLSEFGSTKIVVYVQDVRKKWLRENLLFIHFLGTKFSLHYTLKSCWRINSTHAACCNVDNCRIETCYLEFLRHEDALEGDLVSGPGHAEQPGDPLQEQHAHLHQHNHHNPSNSGSAF